MISQFEIFREEVIGQMDRIIDETVFGGSYFHSNSILESMNNMHTQMVYVLDKSSNIREEEDITIDDLNFDEELDLVIADDGDNISDNNTNNLSVLFKSKEKRISRDRVMVKRGNLQWEAY